MDNVNFLQELKIVRIILEYINKDGVKVQDKTQLRYVDKDTIFVASSSDAATFKPVKNKTKVTISVISSDGVYSTNTIIKETDISALGVLYILKTPSSWRYIQKRLWKRKETNFPIKIEYSDYPVINASVYNISLGGVSVVIKDCIPKILKKIPCIISIQFDEEVSKKVRCDGISFVAKYVRNQMPEEEYFNGEILCYKFQKLSPEQHKLLLQALLYL